jgi:DNA-directed RNA polymerase subunit RPC12/RpoP
MDAAQESQVRILIHCPQCGGDIDFLEEAQVIHCEFCGSSLLVAGRAGVLRYVLPAQLKDPQAAAAQAVESLRKTGKVSPRPVQTFLFYAPFWRMRGMVYRWVFGLKPMKIEIQSGGPPPMERLKVLLTRILDHTIPGYAGLEIGLSSLGVRAQALRLQPFGREQLENRESFLPLEVSLEQAQSEAESLANVFFEAEELTPEVILQRVVGKNFSVIYFPIWYVECQHTRGREVFLIDAVGGTGIGSLADGSPIQQRLKSEESRKSFEFSEIRFLPFRCPNCGWEFPFRPLSMLHFCPNCRRLFREKSGEWAETIYSVISPPAGQSWEKLLWVPFWRCKTLLESPGERLENMASFYQLAPPLRVVNPEKEARRPIYFYVPALKFRNPQVIHNLASRLTFIQPDLKPASFPDGCHPLTAGASLPDADASEMGPVILGAMIPQGNRRARTWLKDCRVELREPQTLYFPFAQADLFWKELSTGLSFQRNALSEDPSAQQNS